jgi:HSP20 family protein
MAQSSSSNSGAATAIERRDEQTTALTTTSASTPEVMEQNMSTWYTPLVDVAETGEAFLFQADLPGVRPQDLEVTFDRGQLVIQARVAMRQRAGEYRPLLREYGVGHYYRSFAIQTPIDADGIKAELKDGVLSLFVPKAVEARARRVQISSA